MDSMNKILCDLITQLEHLQDGGRFDLTDSPKSFMSQVHRLVKEAKERQRNVVVN